MAALVADRGDIFHVALLTREASVLRLEDQWLHDVRKTLERTDLSIKEMGVSTAKRGPSYDLRGSVELGVQTEESGAPASWTGESSRSRAHSARFLAWQQTQLGSDIARRAADNRTRMEELKQLHQSLAFESEAYHEREAQLTKEETHLQEESRRCLQQVGEQWAALDAREEALLETAASVQRRVLDFDTSGAQSMELAMQVQSTSASQARALQQEFELLADERSELEAREAAMECLESAFNCHVHQCCGDDACDSQDVLHTIRQKVVLQVVHDLVQSDPRLGTKRDVVQQVVCRSLGVQPGDIVREQVCSLPSATVCHIAPSIEGMDAQHGGFASATGTSVAAEHTCQVPVEIQSPAPARMLLFRGQATRGDSECSAAEDCSCQGSMSSGSADASQRDQRPEGRGVVDSESCVLLPSRSELVGIGTRLSAGSLAGSADRSKESTVSPVSPKSLTGGSARPSSASAQTEDPLAAGLSVCTRQSQSSTAAQSRDEKTTARSSTPCTGSPGGAGSVACFSPIRRQLLRGVPPSAGDPPFRQGSVEVCVTAVPLQSPPASVVASTAAAATVVKACGTSTVAATGVRSGSVNAPRLALLQASGILATPVSAQAGAPASSYQPRGIATPLLRAAPAPLQRVVAGGGGATLPKLPVPATSPGPSLGPITRPLAMPGLVAVL